MAVRSIERPGFRRVLPLLVALSFLLLLDGAPALAQAGGLTVQIYDAESDETLPGVSVLLSNTNQLAHNSALETIEVRMKPNIQIQGTPGLVPENADVPHQWRDVLGVRIGADVMVVPDMVAVRAGGFFESQGQDAEYVNVDFHQGWKAGPPGSDSSRPDAGGSRHGRSRLDRRLWRQLRAMERRRG